MGQNLLYQLGNPKGIKGLYANVGGGKNKSPGWRIWARWTTYPEDWPDMAQAGWRRPWPGGPRSSEIPTNLWPATGDEMLLEILKLHHKL